MDEVKDKVKGFMKKVNKPLSSSSSFSSSRKFKGQGRVLGSSSSEPANPIYKRPFGVLHSNPKTPSAALENSKPLPQITPNPDNETNIRTSIESNRGPDCKKTDDFDPFGSLITSGKISVNGFSLNVFECPICGVLYRSEEEGSIHVDSCMDNNQSPIEKDVASDSYTELEVCVGSFLSAKPPVGSVEVVLKLLKNIAREPENAMFRKIRMSNPKIREAVGEVSGCVELLECVGFELVEEKGETWAVMEVPMKGKCAVIEKAVSLLEARNLLSYSSVIVPVEPKNVDRQTRVFFSVPERVAAKIQLPDSFYKLSLEEVRKEADSRKKKIADSQLLIPKSLKEKQAKMAMRKYKKTVIRFQFPDGVVLQAVFSPSESTSALYEFVGSALKEGGLKFELLHPVVIKRRVIPCFPPVAITLEEEGLVPSALIKCRPIETDTMVFTGLRDQLLENSEPLVIESAIAPLS